MKVAPADLSAVFVGASVALLALTGGPACAGKSDASSSGGRPAPMFADGARILFIGDSITDGGRGRTEDPNHIYGQDYAFLIAARFGAQFPERQWTFFNRGVSGNRVTDLAARWETDVLALHPDVVSILVGVNDAGSVVLNKDPVTAQRYEEVYDQLLGQTVASNPGVKIVLCQPFLLHGEGADAFWSAYAANVKERQEIVARLASKYRVPVVPLQEVFYQAAARAPAKWWVWDGVHPTAAGHQLIADAWIHTYASYYLTSKRDQAAASRACSHRQVAQDNRSVADLLTRARHELRPCALLPGEAAAHGANMLADGLAMARSPLLTTVGLFAAAFSLQRPICLPRPRR